MMQLISDAYRGWECEEQMDEMFRLRHRVFKERLDWDVKCYEGREIDGFDDLNPAYLMYRGLSGQIEGCVRMLPTTGPNMLRDTFPTLLDGTACPSGDTMWESSRFSLDVQSKGRSPVGLHPATHELFAGMIEFGLAWGLDKIVTVTDARMERILKRAEWPLERIGRPKEIGKTTAVAGYLDVSSEALARVREAGGLRGPVLWMPAAIPMAA